MAKLIYCRDWSEGDVVDYRGALRGSGLLNSRARRRSTSLRGDSEKRREIEQTCKSSVLLVLLYDLWCARRGQNFHWKCSEPRTEGRSEPSDQQLGINAGTHVLRCYPHVTVQNTSRRCFLTSILLNTFPNPPHANLLAPTTAPPFQSTRDS